MQIHPTEIEIFLIHIILQRRENRRGADQSKVTKLS
jgi:hypothetical protein